MVVNDDETWQILILRPQPVSHPRADTRETHQQGARVPLIVRHDVIIRTPLARADQGNVIDHAADVREQLRDLDSALAVLLELERTLHQRPGITLADPNPALATQRLAMVFRQHRLRVKGVDVADSAAHEQRDDGLGSWFEMTIPGSQRRLNVTGAFASGYASIRISGQQAFLRHHRGQRDPADAFARLEQKIAARHELLLASAMQAAEWILLAVFGHDLPSNGVPS